MQMALPWDELLQTASNKIKEFDNIALYYVVLYCNFTMNLKGRTHTDLVSQRARSQAATATILGSNLT